MKVQSSIIENKYLRVKSLNIGASLYEVYDKQREINLILNLGSFKNYISKNFYVGATCGRFAGRISNARFKINNKIFKLSKNEGKNTLHGGKTGFDRLLWKKTMHAKHKIVYTLESKHLDQGFPGKLIIFCTYELNKKNFIIRYEYISNKKTYVNLTNHSYWNLNKSNKSKIFNHDLKINSEKYLEVNNSLIPTGRFINTKNSIFDFKKFSNLNYKISQLYNLKKQNGFDLTYLVNKRPDKYIATLKNKDENIKIDIFSDLPAITLYTAQHLKFKKQLFPFNGICLETEFCPDSPNHNNFPSTLTEPNKKYAYFTKIKIN